MNNQTECTNKEIRGNYCFLDDGTKLSEGNEVCIGDRRYVCRNGQMKRVGGYCES